MMAQSEQIPLHSTVIFHEESYDPCMTRMGYGLCCEPCKDKRVMRWTKVNPSPKLLEFGLTAQKLNEEVDALNIKAQETLNSKQDNFRNYGYAALVFFLVAITVGVLVATQTIVKFEADVRGGTPALIFGFMCLFFGQIPLFAVGYFA
eukprot:273404_1